MTQTAIFKEWVRQFAEEEAASHLNGELLIGEIQGSFFTGLKLKEVEWWYDDERAIYAETIDLSFNPLHLLNREVHITGISLIDPDIRLRTNKDGILNVSRIVKSRDVEKEEKDTTRIEASDPWTITLKDFEILGGSLSYRTETNTERPVQTYPVSFPEMDYGNIKLRNLYLSMSGVSRGNTHQIDIRSMNFTLEDPDFTVSHFSLQAVFSPNLTKINRIRMITDRSNINITGGISDFNLLGSNDVPFGKSDMDVTVRANRLHSDELKMFIPSVWFLEGDAEVEITASGTFEEVAVEYINLQLGRTNLELTGTLQNITEGANLFIDASIEDSRIDPLDINTLLPHFDIPDYSHLGVMDVNATYSGQPRDFNTTIDLYTRAGLYSGTMDMDLTGRLIRYDGSVVTRDANIATLFEQEYYPVDLSGRVSLKGEGTSFDDVVADANLLIDHMKIADLSFDSLETNVFARNHEIRLTSTGQLEASNFYIDAVSDIHDINRAPFDIRLMFESLDLARVMKDSSFTSDLTFSLSGSGTGLRPESMLGEFAVELEPSRFRDYEFVGEPLYVSLVEIDSAFHELNIESEVVDVYLAGEFDLPTIIDISIDHMRFLISSIRRDIESIVTGDVNVYEEYASSLQIDKPLDTVYDINIKNMDAVAILLGRDEFEVEVEGKLYGYFRAIENMLRLGGDIEIDHFLYLSATERMLFDKIVGSYNIDNDYRAHGLEGIYSVFDITADGIYTQSLTINDANIRADMRGNNWQVYSKALIDTLVSYEIDAVAQFDTTALHTDLNTFVIGYEGIDFANNDTLTMRYDSAGVWFDNFTLYHNDVSTFNVAGLYALDKIHSLEFSLSQIELEGIHRAISPGTEQRRQPLFRGFADITGYITGTTNDLVSTMRVRMADLEYGELQFGLLTGNFNYEDTRLDIDADISYPDDTTKTAFKIGGYIPFDLFPTGGSERVPDGPINVHVFSEGFDLSIIDPFLAEVRNFRANMTSDVAITGTVEDPRYDGELEISNGQFVFIPNNMTYHFNGRLEPRQNELVISNLELENRRRDFADGRMNFSGSIQTRGLTIRDFDVSASGQLMVLRSGARRPGDMVYGDLTMGTGRDGIRLAGTIDESSLTGSVLIRSASLTFPPARTTAFDRTGSIVSYTVLEDTEVEEERLTPLEIFFRDVAQDRQSSQSQQETGSTFIDGLDYDLTIQTDGRVEMTMIFNQATGEELIARIETTSLRLYRDELTGLRLVGNVDIVEPSAYSFYRRFNARGSISFIGPPDNPELDITAAYTGQRMAVQTAGVDPDDPVQATGTPEQVEVRLHITGDRYEPQLDINLFVNNEQREGDVETDAISYILTGRFQSDLESGDYRAISADFGRGIPATFMSGVATSLLSNLFSDFLRNEVRFIRTAEIVWYGGNIMDTAELRVSGELRNFYWTIGGRVFNDIGNTNFSFQIPMGPVFNSDRWTNLFLELERRSQSLEFSSEELRPVNAARLYYSISF